MRLTVRNPLNRTRSASRNEQTAWPNGVVIRFLNMGGALVDLHSCRFTTQWTLNGPPYAAKRPHEVEGLNWRCLGCQEYGREGDTYNDPGYRDLREARDAAQEHAERCRAVPRPVLDGGS